MSAHEARPNPILEGRWDFAAENMKDLFDDDSVMDSLVERAQQSTISLIATQAIPVERDNLPAEWAENMYLPRRFTVDGLKLSSVSLTKEKLWVLSGSFWVNEEEFKLAASPSGTELVTEGLDGASLHIRGLPVLAESILRGFLPRDDRETIFSHDSDSDDWAVNAIMRELGEDYGVYTEDHESVIEDMEDVYEQSGDSRVTYTKISRLETKESCGRRMLCKVALDYGDGVTEHLWDMRRLTTADGRHTQNISAYRTPSDVPIEDYAALHDFYTPSLAELHTADSAAAIGNVALFMLETIKRFQKRTL